MYCLTVGVLKNKCLIIIMIVKVLNDTSEDKNYDTNNQNEL